MAANVQQLTTVVTLAVTLADCGIAAENSTTWLGRAAALLPLVKEVPGLLDLSATELQAEWAAATPEERAGVVASAEAQLNLGTGALTSNVDAILDAGMAIVVALAKATAAVKALRGAA